MAEEDVLARIAEVFRGGGDPDYRSWHAAAVELAQSDDPRVLASVEAALDADDYDTRRAAIYVMSLRGAPASERLIEIARSSSSARDRDYALLVLSNDPPTESAEEAVIAASVLDPNPHVRLRTREFLAFNLVGVRGRDPKPRLRQFMRHGGLRERWRALRALRRVRKHERMLDRVHLSGWRRAIWVKYRHAVVFLRYWRSRDDD